VVRLRGDSTEDGLGEPEVSKLHHGDNDLETPVE
jgi:hypothetical protein